MERYLMDTNVISDYFSASIADSGIAFMDAAILLPCTQKMTITYFREYCLSKPGTSEETPFDVDTLCFKVGGKIFAIIDIELFESANLKCDPERAVDLREQNEGIIPGYHMNKKHWNTVLFNGQVGDSLILELVDHSYDLVFRSLPKKIQAAIS